MVDHFTVIREALNRLTTQDRFDAKAKLEALDALDRLEALSRVHVTQASHDLLVAEGWLDPAHVDAARSVWAKVDGYVPARHRSAMEEALGVRGGEEQRA